MGIEGRKVVVGGGGGGVKKQGKSWKVGQGEEGESQEKQVEVNQRK